ncbi:MAG TPA: D-2-hydroxyacid dehydrogenase [Bacillales bacterium]|nr:D-2-hydroxyacid dehydrogenase [Bacillales bacterium]
MNSPQPNILVFNPDSSEAKAYAESVRHYGFTSVKSASTTEEANKLLSETEVILGWKFPLELLIQPVASSVRWFQSTGAGVDDLVADDSIPVDITLTRIIDQFGSSISEYVFMFLLHVAKDGSRMRRAQTEKLWDPFIPASLAGKTIGVAGLGSIGSEIVRKARAFDMSVYGLSYSGKQAALVDRHFTPGQWSEFVGELDYLVLTLPLTEATHHIVSKKVLISMKSTACLVNVGRGALIKEDDLIDVMQSGHLHAAVLDVFENEPIPKNHVFWTMPNVLVTSHLSGPSTVDGVSHFFAENVKRYLAGKALAGVVDKERGY